MNLGDAVQGELVRQAVAYGGLLWIVLAISTGLWASEIKKRSFWFWCLLALVTGPVAWYLIFIHLGEWIPPEQRRACPNCTKTIRKDAHRCRHCGWIDPETRNRARDLGRQAATMVFTAKRLLGGTRKAADRAARRRG